MKQIQESVPVKIEVVTVASRQEQKRRERSQAGVAVTPEHLVDWRSYEHRAMPARWRVR